MPKYIPTLGMSNPMTTQGDMISGGVSGEPKRLAPGTSGQFLKTQGAGADPVWANVVTGITAGWEKIADTLVSADCQYVDFTGLDLDASKAYMIIFNIWNDYAGSVDYSLYVNGDYTATNYYVQLLTADGATVSAVRNNNAVILTLDIQYKPGKGTLLMTRDLSPSVYYGRVNVIGNINWGYQMYPVVRNVSLNYTVKTNITSLRFYASQANGIGANSRIMIFRVKG